MNRAGVSAHLFTLVLAMPNLAAAEPNGAALFEERCALCHGAGGQGNGRLSKLLEVAPANLTRSRANDLYLRSIITLGGAALGRSDRMPAWGGDLNAAEVDALVRHINTLRNPFRAEGK